MKCKECQKSVVDLFKMYKTCPKESAGRGGDGEVRTEEIYVPISEIP